MKGKTSFVGGGGERDKTKGPQTKFPVVLKGEGLKGAKK